MRFIRTTIAIMKAKVENNQDSLKTTTKKKAVVNAIIMLIFVTSINSLREIKDCG
jgi:hypothetical protein